MYTARLARTTGMTVASASADAPTLLKFDFRADCEKALMTSNSEGLAVNQPLAPDLWQELSGDGHAFGQWVQEQVAQVSGTAVFIGECAKQGECTKQRWEAALEAFMTWADYKGGWAIHVHNLGQRTEKGESPLDFFDCRPT